MYSQPPTHPNLASHSFYRLTYNLSQLRLTHRTLFEKYLHASETPLFPDYKLIPSDLSLRCTFARDRRCELGKRFHHDCVPISKLFWGTFEVEHCDRYENVVTTFLSERDSWFCVFCDVPLFIHPECLLD